MTKRQASSGVTEGNLILRHISSEIQSLFFNKIYLMDNIFSLFTKNFKHLCMYMYIHSTLSMFRSDGIHTDYFSNCFTQTALIKNFIIMLNPLSCSLDLENFWNPPNIPKHFSSDDVKILNFIHYITDFNVIIN